MSSKSRGPGPGAYALPPLVGFDRHDASKHRGAQYTFGTVHKDLKKNIGPGPGAYKLEKVYRYGNDGTPKFTMAPLTFQPEICRSPGPAAHDVRGKPFFKGQSAPAYTLRIKHRDMSGKGISPPPNAYSIQLNTIKPRGPAFSMGMDLPMKPHVRSPGPATYGRPNLNAGYHKNPAYSLTGRNQYQFKKYSPGPNTYDMSYHRPGKSGPSYSFGIKHVDYSLPTVIGCDD